MKTNEPTGVNQCIVNHYRVGGMSPKGRTRVAVRGETLRGEEGEKTPSGVKCEVIDFSTGSFTRYHPTKDRLNLQRTIAHTKVESSLRGWAAQI